MINNYFDKLFFLLSKKITKNILWLTYDFISKRFHKLEKLIWKKLLNYVLSFSKYLVCGSTRPKSLDFGIAPGNTWNWTTVSPIFVRASNNNFLMVVLPHPGGPTIATPVLLFNWSFNWMHLFAISLPNSCSAQSSNKTFCKSFLSMNVEDDGSAVGKTSSRRERNRGVSSSVNFGNVEDRIAATNLQ